jgi:hypothetical protein
VNMDLELNLALNKNRGGLLLILLQFSWLVLSPHPFFPAFDLFLLLFTSAFVFKPDLFLQAAREIKIRDFALYITIISLPACWAGLEKPLASFLIWIVGVGLQAKILEFLYSWATRREPVDSKQLFLVLSTQLILAFFLLGDAGFYENKNLQYGTVITAQHLRFDSIIWMAFFYFFPAVLLAMHQRPTSRSFWKKLQEDGDASFIRPFHLILIVLLAIMLLLNVEMVRPHWGQLILLGDESGYIKYARNIGGFERFLPSQPPLYTGVLGAFTLLIGDRPEIGLVINFIMLIGTFALLVYAGHALTKNLFFGVLAAMFFVGNRGTYMFSWTALTEPMNALVLVAAMAAALYLIQKRTAPAYILFGLATVSTVMLRSQNGLFTLGLIGLTFLYLYLKPGLRPTRKQLILFASMLVVPHLLWGTYRLLLTGHFNFADGRGLYMFYGFNAPGTHQGMDATTWSKSLDAWFTQNPHRSKIWMLWDAIRMRIENPAETLSFWYWRTLELFNFRFTNDYGLIPTLKMNAQLMLLYGLFFLTLIRRPSLTHAATLILWAGFYITFIFIYAESRYRYPGDVLLYLAVVRGLHEAFVQRPTAWHTPVQTPYLKAIPVQPIYLLSVGTLIFLALPHLLGMDTRFPGFVPSKPQLARSEKIQLTGLAPVPLQNLRNARPKDLAGKLVTLPLSFDGFRFRPGNLFAAVNERIPAGVFHYASFPEKYELTLKNPEKISATKIALDTQSMYGGSTIRTAQPYIAKVLLMPVPAVRGPEGWTLMGYLLELEPRSAKP